MNRTKIKLAASDILPYSALPVLLLLLWFVQRDKLVLISLLLRAILVVFGYIAAVEDAKYKRVPNSLVGTLLLVWVFVMIPQFIVQRQTALALMISGGIGALLGGLLFLLVYAVSRGGLGGGDVKLMAVSGLYLGFGGVLPAMLYGSVLAAVTAIILILTKRIGRKDSIPLVPFLYIGMLLAMFTQ